MSLDDSKVPRRALGSQLSNSKLPATVPIIGLGCSSFSTFFWTSEERDALGDVTMDNIASDHPRVQEWIETIRFAVIEKGITLLDTSPWYGHGTSEAVIGLAMNQHDELREGRPEMTINTKVGRYEADPAHQFDFSYETTMASIQRSLVRMNSQYIDVLQLHDPEFAPTLDQLMTETIPAMRKAQSKGLCRALGMTGYPLEVQYQVLQRSLEVFGENIWDQALTYCHFNLHNTRLTNHPIGTENSFADFLQNQNVGLLAAAPLSMGLLTPQKEHGQWSVPSWHPASAELKSACQHASRFCQQEGVDIALLATLFAMAEPKVACTIIGCKDPEEVIRAADAACRFHRQGSLHSCLSEKESKVLHQLLDPTDGPFAKVWREDLYYWDGILHAQKFWKAVPSSVHANCWHDRSLL